MKYIVYDSTTGAIRRTGTCAPGDFELQAASGESVVEGSASDDRQYILNEAIVDKTAMGATIDKVNVQANAIDFATIGNLPPGCEVSITGPNGLSLVVVDDGSLELTFDLVGTYRVRCQSTTKLSQEFTINAT